MSWLENAAKLIRPPAYVIGMAVAKFILAQIIAMEMITAILVLIIYFSMKRSIKICPQKLQTTKR
jgi:hypothetical protein